ncbi:hypothetical protein [Hydrocoleum sp. CS-953]|uniref:hypothetical protein n=1 Tax=Hydrocoleum sp. CS-953 TaxID=1671698 RepID=UPI00143DA86F|nr:hypothetical protein [Hydrocoleum sp. CS-953]
MIKLCTSRASETAVNINSSIDILRVGDPNTPAIATPDPDILVYLESLQRLLFNN